MSTPELNKGANFSTIEKGLTVEKHTSDVEKSVKKQVTKKKTEGMRESKYKPKIESLSISSEDFDSESTGKHP